MKNYVHYDENVLNSC